MTGFAFDTAGIGFDNSIYGYDGVVAPGHNNAAWTNNGGALSTAPNAPSLSFNAGQTVTPTGTSMFMAGGTPTVTVSANTGPSGQLAAGHWIAAKMPLTATRIVHPRPDSETTAAAYHRNAHPSVQYVCPIFIQGGAYPFWFDIISAPAGATIGRRYSDTDYGVIRWTPTSGIQTFVVRVYDQDGSIVDITWSVSVNSTWVSFIDSVNGNDANSGTFAAPWQTYSKAAATVTGGKAICCRAGTYTPIAAGTSMSSSTHNTLFNFPGETATFNCAVTNTAQGLWFQNSVDCMVAGLTFSGALLGSNPRHFANLAQDRQYLWRCSFSNNGGSSGADNSACWYLSSVTTQRNYVAAFENRFDNLPSSANGYMAIDTYQCKYLALERNILGTPNANPQHLLFIKGAGNQEVSVRGNTYLSPWGTDSNFYLGGDGSASAPPSTNQELCYNTIISTNTSANWSTTAFNVNGAQNNANPATVWSYRNTIVGIPAIYYQSINVLTFTSESDAIVHNGTTAGLVGKWVSIYGGDSSTTFRNPTSIPGIHYTIGGTECQGNTSAGILDASSKLTGSFRTTYLGTRGAEIA